jgi:hypothetical protein
LSRVAEEGIRLSEGKEVLRVGCCGLVKEDPDSVAASVAWPLIGFSRIVVLRRWDGAVGFLDIPKELSRDLSKFNPDQVRRYWVLLDRAVAWGLVDMTFSLEIDAEGSWSRDGARPAELGCVRRFGAWAVGVDIGEYVLPERYRAS